MNLTLFTTHCPRCLILEKKLQEKNIPFKIEENVSEILEAGFTMAPILKLNQIYLDFSEAIKWINNLEV